VHCRRQGLSRAAQLGAQNQRDQKPDNAALLDAPNVPRMVVDSDGTLHFGPRTVPLPALANFNRHLE